MNKKTKTNPTTLSRARQMRRQPAEPEKRVWYHLQRKQLGGFKFRRQQPIGRFIVDFYCYEVKLVVELDGNSHFSQDEYDESPTEWLESQGYRVIRFTNVEVMTNMEGVLRVILSECEKYNRS